MSDNRLFSASRPPIAYALSVDGSQTELVELELTRYDLRCLAFALRSAHSPQGQDVTVSLPWSTSTKLAEQMEAVEADLSAPEDEGKCYGCHRQTNGDFHGVRWCGWCAAPEPTLAEPIECDHFSASGIDQTEGPNKVWICDNCGWLHLTHHRPDGITEATGLEEVVA